MGRAGEERQAWAGEGGQPSQNKSEAFPPDINGSLQPWKGEESRNQVSAPSSSRVGWPVFTCVNKWKDRKMKREGKGKENGREAFKWDVDSGGGPVSTSPPPGADGMELMVVVEQAFFPACLY